MPDLSILIGWGNLNSQSECSKSTKPYFVLEIVFLCRGHVVACHITLGKWDRPKWLTDTDSPPIQKRFFQRQNWQENKFQKSFGLDRKEGARDETSPSVEFLFFIFIFSPQFREFSKKIVFCAENTYLLTL